MKERPILFSAPMVRAILEDRKTATRRIARLTATGRVARAGRNWHVDDPNAALACPYGQPGDRLWVREAFALENSVDGNLPPHIDGRPVKVRPDDDWDGICPAWTQPHYRATDPAPDLCCEREDCAQCRDHDMGPHWRPSIHMPRWASRITLEVTGVRVERLQDMTTDQAIAEGMRTFPHKGGTAYAWDADDAHGFGSATGAFRWLWDSINGDGAHHADPWVWVVEFKRVEAQQA